MATRSRSLKRNRSTGQSFLWPIMFSFKEICTRSPCFTSQREEDTRGMAWERQKDPKTDRHWWKKYNKMYNSFPATTCNYSTLHANSILLAICTISSICFILPTCQLQASRSCKWRQHKAYNIMQQTDFYTIAVIEKMFSSLAFIPWRSPSELSMLRPHSLTLDWPSSGYSALHRNVWHIQWCNI